MAYIIYIYSQKLQKRIYFMQSRNEQPIDIDLLTDNR